MKNKYAAGFFMGLKEEMQYRADYLTNLISVVFPLMIQLSLWTILFSGKPEETVIMGYTFPQMMLYSVTATMSARFLATEVHSSVAQDIRDGALNRSLIQPVRYPLQKFCIFFGKKVFHFLVNMGILRVLLAVLWARGQASLRPWWVLCYFADLLPAYYLNFLIFLNISFLAFWLVEVSRIFGVISILLTIFSGGILPLDIFGAGVVEFLQNFPFFYTTYFLTNILTGRLNGGQMLQGAAIQAVWIVLLTGLAWLLWKKGVGRYEAVGG